MEMAELQKQMQALGMIQWKRSEVGRDFFVPFAVDFSRAFSQHEVAKEVCSLLWKKASRFSFDLLAGSPVVGSAFATHMAWDNGASLVALDRSRDVEKVVGMYKTGQTALLICAADLFGHETLELIDDLRAEGIVVRDVLSLINFELGFKQRLKKEGLSPHFIWTISEIAETLHDDGKMSQECYRNFTDFFEERKEHGKSS